MSNHMSRCVATETGLRIGCAHQRPLPQPDEDAEQIQRVILDDADERMERRWRCVEWAVYLVTVLIVVAASAAFPNSWF